MHFLVIHGSPLSQPVAVSLQPYLPLSRKDFFKDFTQDQLLTLAQDFPSFKQTLLFFLEQTLYIYGQENACPDMIGPDNIVIVYRNGAPHLHILDTGIHYLDTIQIKSPNLIPQIQEAIQKIKTLHNIFKHPSKTQAQIFMPALSPVTLSSTIYFTEHIQTYAAKYYPQLDLQTTKIHLTKKENRLTSRLFYFDISDQYQTKSILIKASFPDHQNKNSAQVRKPSLYPATDPIDMSTLEHQALTTIQSHFQNDDPALINTIKVLDFLPDKHAIIMEVVQLPNLRSRYLKAAFIGSKKQKHPIILAFQNTGKWLQSFHSIPIKDHVQDRHTHPIDFHKGFDSLIEYLIKTTRYKQYLDNISTETISLANEHIPHDLPLGLGHGDFAPRNILTNNQGAVTVIDTFAKWNAPIYEDIGYFLNNIRTSWFQITTLGLFFSLQRIVAYEKAFLSGYFQDSPIPYPQIKIYEILALLDKWADVVDRANTNTNRKLLKPIILTLTAIYTKKHLTQLIKEIQQHSKDSI